MILNLLLTADDVHNWSTPYVQRQWCDRLTTEQREMVRVAEACHHQDGADAAALAKYLNRLFGPSLRMEE